MLNVLTDISWVPAIRTDFLTAYFRWMPYLVHVNILLIAIAFLYWSRTRTFFRDFTLMLLFSGMTVNFLKEFFKLPRPSLLHLVAIRDTSYTFPSGDAEVITVFWLMLAFHFRKTWLYVLSVFIILNVMFSRVYLGVHYPRDVIAGALLGSLFVIFYYSKFGQNIILFFKKHTLSWIVLLALWIAFYTKFVVLSQASSLHIVTLGLFMGLNLGFLCFKWSKCTEHCPWYDSHLIVTRSKRYFAFFALTLFLVFDTVLRDVLPSFIHNHAYQRMLAYVIIGFYISFLSFCSYQAIWSLFSKLNSKK